MSEPFTINGYEPRHPEFIQGLLRRRDQLAVIEEHKAALEAISRSSSTSVKPPHVGTARLPKPESEEDDAIEIEEDGEDYTDDFLAVLNGDLT